MKLALNKNNLFKSKLPKKKKKKIKTKPSKTSFILFFFLNELFVRRRRALRIINNDYNMCCIGRAYNLFSMVINDRQLNKCGLVLVPPEFNVPHVDRKRFKKIK